MNLMLDVRILGPLLSEVLCTIKSSIVCCLQPFLCRKIEILCTIKSCTRRNIEVHKESNKYKGALYNGNEIDAKMTYKAKMQSVYWTWESKEAWTTIGRKPPSLIS